MAKVPHCDVEGCMERKFYVNGPHCLGHIRNPPKKAPVKADKSESSDEPTTP